MTIFTTESMPHTPLVLAISGQGAPWDFLYAGLLLLPIVLTFAELGADRPGSASPFQIGRSYGLVGATFLVAWFQLGGLVMASALLVVGVTERLGLLLTTLFGVRVEALWLAVIVVALAAANEWLSEDDRWRSRTVLVWAAAGANVGILLWVLATHPPERADLPTLDFGGHKLATVALLASGLWFVDLILNHRRQMRRPNRTLRTTLDGVWLGTALLAAAATSVVLRSPSFFLESRTEGISWGEARLEMLVTLVGLTLCWLGVSRLVSRTVRLTTASRPLRGRSTGFT